MLLGIEGIYQKILYITPTNPPPPPSKTWNTHTKEMPKKQSLKFFNFPMRQNDAACTSQPVRKG